MSSSDIRKWIKLTEGELSGDSWDVAVKIYQYVEKIYGTPQFDPAYDLIDEFLDDMVANGDANKSPEELTRLYLEICCEDPHMFEDYWPSWAAKLPIAQPLLQKAYKDVAKKIHLTMNPIHDAIEDDIKEEMLIRTPAGLVDEHTKKPVNTLGDYIRVAMPFDAKDPVKSIMADISKSTKQFSFPFFEKLYEPHKNHLPIDVFVSMVLVPFLKKNWKHPL